MNRSGIWIGLGSNIGDKSGNLRRAEELLGVAIISRSSLYETEPVEYIEQPWFVNSVIRIETAWPVRQLLQECQRVENQMQRKRDVPKGPRTIDLDILFYNDLILREPDLIVPHPAVAERRFVLEPLNEIAPDFVHPLLKRTIAELLAACADRSSVRKL